MKTTKKKWWPRNYEKFYFLTMWGNVEFKYWEIGHDLTCQYELLGVYRTKKEAETALHKIKKFVKEEL